KCPSAGSASSLAVRRSAPSSCCSSSWRRTSRRRVRSGACPHDGALSIVVTGHQWWWETEYEDTMPARRLRTANELHIPVGRPVRIKTRSADVIHSLWVPQLHGKRDLIPGAVSEIWIR